MTRLQSTLSTADLPGPELDAARLDGELYRLGSAAVPIDEVPSPALRAAALAAELPDRLIAEQHTAAWVWGALDGVPAIHEVCSDLAARRRPTLSRHLRVREVVLAADDVVALGGLTVTTRLRTAIDLVRFVDHWSDAERRTVRRLMALGGFGVLECEQTLARRRNLPGKVRARERLLDCL